MAPFNHQIYQSIIAFNTKLTSSRVEPNFILSSSMLCGVLSEPNQASQTI